jgi:hypothetical protein
LERAQGRRGPAGTSIVKAIETAASDGRFGSGKRGGESMRAALMPEIVRGYGMHRPATVKAAEVGPNGIYQPVIQKGIGAGELQDKLEAYARASLKAVVNRGLTKPNAVMKGFSPELGNGLRMASFASTLPLQQLAAQWTKDLQKFAGKNFSLSSPLASGFVPFDLVPFVRTIYPVYTPLRNKIPRVPGQGLFHRAKILASITGSLPGSLGTLQDDSTSEFFGGSFAEWPNPLPNSGAQTSYDLIVPYKFFALTEGVSWLSQFAGQGFDDLYGLASLVLLQEFMLLEEHDMLASSSQALTAPAAPTATVRNSLGAGEVPLTFTGTDLFVLVTALDFWGETAYAAGNVTTVTTAVSGTSVIDVTIPVASNVSAAPGGLGWAIYIAQGSANPGRTAFFRFTTNTLPGGTVGGIKFTLQGAVPTTGANPPAADSGTGATTRMESLVAILSGRSYNGGSGPYPGPGSSPAVNAGYYNGAVGNTFIVSVLQNALQQMFNGPTGYFANPSEIITSANDAAVLAASIISEQVAAYQLRIQQSEVAGVVGGVAVANVVNPVTRSMPEILVHPYMPAGNALLMSYTLPQTQNNLGNVVENVMVQDYAQIGWPVIDPTFRQSLLRFGLLWLAAPQYCGLLQGLQRSATTPYM